MTYLIPSVLFTLTALFCCLAERARRKYRAEMRVRRFDQCTQVKRPVPLRDTVRR